MPSFRELIHEALPLLEQAQIPQETAQVFLLELSQKESYDLFPLMHVVIVLPATYSKVAQI